MKVYTLPPLKVLLLCIVLIFQFSCSKDSDLLTDYVLADTLDSQGIANLVVDDTYQISLSGSMVLDVLANDTFENEAEVVITETSTPTNGTVEINNDETLTYTPNAEIIEQVSDTTETAVGEVDTFTYTVEVDNGEGTTTSEVASVVITTGDNAAKQDAVSLQSYGAVGDGVKDDTAALQAAFDNETNITSDANKTYLVSSLIALDKIAVQTVDFNGSKIEKNHSTDWALFINKAGMSGANTTIENLEIDGNSNYGQLMYINSRTNLTNVEIHHAVENDKDSAPRGISITVNNNIGVQGEWLFDNVHIHDIKNTDRTGTPRSQPYGGWGAGLEIFWLQQVTGTGMQFVMINSQINDVYGDEASGLMVNSQNIDISNTNNTLWFENVTIKDCERRAAKMYTGNQTWVNCNIHAVDRTNPNIGLDSAPAGLFNIGNRSAAVGANNNLICGTTFHAAPTTPNDAWEVDFWFGGDLGKNGTEVEIRNCTFESGDDPNTSWANAAAQIQLYGEINSFKICNTSIGNASTAARGIKLDKGPNFALQGGEKLQIDSKNTYTISQAKFVEDFTVTTEYVISDLSGDCAECPTK